MAIKHNGVTYDRHQSLELSVRDPSPAMAEWIDVDNRWHDDANYISMAGGPLDDAASFADSEAKERAR